MPEGDLNDSRIPPSVLWLGAVAWKLFEYFEHVDFILSIRSETFLVMFRFFSNYGWWMIGLGGVGWTFLRYKGLKTDIRGEMIWVVGFIAFLWGVLVTAVATGTLPDVIVGYGTAAHNCTAAIDTSRLDSFRGDYDIALVCGVVDSGVDKFTDTRISVSPLYSIHHQPIPIAMKESEAMQSIVDRTIKAGSAISLWSTAILLPKDTDITAIHALSDVPKYHGKILEPGYFQ
jgi:hypothetical protein